MVTKAKPEGILNFKGKRTSSQSHLNKIKCSYSLQMISGKSNIQYFVKICDNLCE